ncbi:MAG: AMP-binding protein, partial [Burkholderiales bacterium]
MIASAHVDTFARDHLPPRDERPDFDFDLPSLAYPDRLNAAGALLDAAIMRGWGERTAIVAPTQAIGMPPANAGTAWAEAAGDGAVVAPLRWSYAELNVVASRIAHVLAQDFGVRPGNRVLLRGPNSPMTAACWFAIVKAGAVAVATMPLLRARELAAVIDKAQVTHALCDARLVAELEAARAACPTLRHVARFGTTAADGIETWMRQKTATYEPVATAADDVAMIAFTSGTTGTPKGTMHFHRDILAACDCWPIHTLCASADDLFTGSPPLAFTFGLGGLLLFPLRIGASTLLLEKASPEALLAAIAQYKPSVLFTAPTSYRAMAQRTAEFDLASLRKCVSAGEALPAATRALWKDATGIEIIDGIGSTELLHIFIS